MKGALRRLEGREYDAEIEAAEQEHARCEENLEEQQSVCETLRKEISKLVSGIEEVDRMIDSIPAEMIDIVNIKAELARKRSCQREHNSLKNNKTNLQEKETLVEKIEEFLDNYDIEDLIKKQRDSQSLESDHDLQAELERIDKKASSLNDPEFLRGCKCLREAEDAPAKKPEVQEKMDIFTTEHCAMDPEGVDKKVVKYNSLIAKKDQTQRDITNTQLLIAQNENSVSSLISDIEALKKRIFLRR